MSANDLSQPLPRLDLAELGDLAQNPTIERALESVRELLGMEVSFTGRITESHQVLETVVGDRVAFGGVGPGAALPIEMTVCHQVLAGNLPNIIPDVQANELAAGMQITQALGVGSFASVPLTFSDGRLYGTMCAASLDPQNELGDRELQFLHVFARLVADQLEREQLEESSRQMELRSTAARALIAAVEARDAYTGQHSEAMVENAGAMARWLGLSEAEVADVENVALLHDIGKIAIPDAILSKPGRLTEEEWEVMRTHSVASARLMAAVPGLEHIAPAVRAEHERWDGGGYPDGLAGEDIPVASRITLVCDAYHAMTSDRPYRKAMPDADARAELQAGAGTQFCPVCVPALFAVLDER
jgi:hypothetical protein